MSNTLLTFVRSATSFLATVCSGLAASNSFPPATPYLATAATAFLAINHLIPRTEK
jgi:hypothetical protein